MILKAISLQHFRSYTQSTFSFSPQTTIIVGPNTAGKSNLLEAIYLLSSGKSFRAEKDTQMISFGEKIAHVKAQIGEDKEQLEVIISDRGLESASKSFSKKFLVNGVAKRRVDFAGLLPALLFVPVDLEIISSSPSHRREFLNAVLEVTDKHYRQSLISYEKALRQRNALLDVVRETGIRNDEQFAYWDDLLIENGSYITKKREELIGYFNSGEKTLLSFSATYEKSEISRERLEQYKGPEIGAGVTLVGPHRDDFFVEFMLSGAKQNVKYFGSRGQQRLVVLQLKLLQLTAIEAAIGYRPLLLLDDIFSELDAEHIQDVLSIITKQQTIITTTHKEFIETGIGEDAMIIELTKKPIP
ncbi:MAG: DNA replication and repair protein RecF [Patescibacteria group bacterium]